MNSTSTTAGPGLGAAQHAPAGPGASERLYEISDFYDAEALLTSDERQVLARLRNFLDEQAKPLLAEYWERGSSQSSWRSR